MGWEKDCQDMKCPKCGIDDHSVNKTISDYDETIERWRRCESCRYSWVTQETIKPPLKPDATPLAKP